MDIKSLPGWSSDNLFEAAPALERSCNRYRAIKSNIKITFGKYYSFPKEWQAACESVLSAIYSGNAQEFRTALETSFTAFSASAGDKLNGLFTGYFEAELYASKVNKDPYLYPIYGRPSNHVIVNLGDFDSNLDDKQFIGHVIDNQLKPYPERKELEQVHLPVFGKPLFWAQDQIDVFLLQVQGSGRVLLPDGTSERIGFAAHNGHSYKSIGRVLIERGDLEHHQASWDGIRKWITENPNKATALLWENPRYIFFQIIEGDGPIGSEGLVLTPGRSLAVDRSHIAMGTPIWLDTTWPSDSDKKLQRLMVAQDTGNAIKGPVRGDFFWGYGAEALSFAGKMKSIGQYYLLLPNATAARISASH